MPTKCRTRTSEDRLRHQDPDSTWREKSSPRKLRRGGASSAGPRTFECSKKGRSILQCPWTWSATPASCTDTPPEQGSSVLDRPRPLRTGLRSCHATSRRQDTEERSERLPGC